MPNPLWWITKDGDDACRQLHERHYSKYKYADGRKPKLFVGPGQKIVLRTWDGGAFFVWRKFIDKAIPLQNGINCAAFRNEGEIRSSELIRQADAIADLLWVGERHYTYVNPKEVRSRNPGYCFIKAGWNKCGFTKGGLLILEKHNLDTDF